MRNVGSVLSASILAGMVLLGGCGSSPPKVAKWTPPVGPPPGYVPPTAALVDPALQQAARREIDNAAEATNDFTRAHAVEALKDTVGADASVEIRKALHYKAAVVRF